jgi:hypothetical protein
MAKQNLSKKGVERFRKKKVPKNERTHKKHGAPGSPGGPAGKLATRSLLRKSKHGDKRNRGERKKKKTPEQLAIAAGNGSGAQGYTRDQKILLVGEGNLSMARALVRLFGGDGRNIVATTFDTEDELKEVRSCHAAAADCFCAWLTRLGRLLPASRAQKYAESVEILEELARSGAARPKHGGRLRRKRD